MTRNARKKIVTDIDRKMAATHKVVEITNNRMISRNLLMQKKSVEKQALTQLQLREVREAFDKADAERFGAINSKELKLAMRELGFEASSQEVLKILAEANEKYSGAIGFQNFLKMITPRILSRNAPRNFGIRG